MNFEEFDSEVRGYAEVDRINPIRIGDILNEGEELFGEKYAQVFTYFPERKAQTITNWKSICRSVPKDVRPKGVRISQMDAVRTLQYSLQNEYLEWAVSNDLGREEILARMQTEGLLIPRTVDCAKLIECAIGKLDRALPIAGEKMKPFIVTASEALHEAMR
jgi:hypothetical protein